VSAFLGHFWRFPMVALAAVWLGLSLGRAGRLVDDLARIHPPEEES
jgi:hypothetical protein